MNAVEKPVLCVDDGEESREAKRMLEEAGITFREWDASKVQPADWSPPFLMHGRNVYGGREAIERFVNGRAS